MSGIRGSHTVNFWDFSQYAIQRHFSDLPEVTLDAAYRLSTNARPIVSKSYRQVPSIPSRKAPTPY